MKPAGTFAIFVCFFLLLGTATPSPGEDSEIFSEFGALKVLGDGPSSLNLGLGVWDVFRDYEAVGGHIEWQFGEKLGFVGPLAGVIANTDGGYLVHAGLYADLAVGEFVITPHTGIGAYEEGDSRDLGGVFEFYSSLTIGYRLDDRAQVGIRFGHISNADLHDRNPGTDMILLNYRHLF